MSLTPHYGRHRRSRGYPAVPGTVSTLVTQRSHVRGMTTAPARHLKSPGGDSVPVKFEEPVNADDAERLERTLAEPVHEAAVQKITYSPVEIAEAAMEDAAGNSARSGRGQGFQLDQEVKDAIEAFAMNTAMQFYSDAGCRVEDVHVTKSYDLICSKDGTSTHVEVKGTTGDGTEVILTFNVTGQVHSKVPACLPLVERN